MPVIALAKPPTRLMTVVTLVLTGLAVSAGAQSHPTALPSGSSLGEDGLDQPRRVFYSEISGGMRSPQSLLGELLFESPSLFGGVARSAGISCGTCHVQGTTNPELFIPGLSSRPGTFDAAGPIFNPQTDRHVLDALTVPSLRGVRFMAPFGHDGRLSSLREFSRNAIVNEFAGIEPSPLILDALVAFMQDIALLPNRRLGADGRLTMASQAERRGETLFGRPFPNNPSMACATCHVPSAVFIDHQQHNVGTGLYKTPTLNNANFNSMYFHDGRFRNYDEVVDYFDRWFELRLGPDDQQDLVAYLRAIGDADEPFERKTSQSALGEISVATSGLEMVVRQRDWSIVSIAADGLAHKIHALQRFFVDSLGTTRSDEGIAERARANAALGDVILELLHLQKAADGRESAALDRSLSALSHLLTAASTPLSQAEPWSLFNPEIMTRHRQALLRLDRSGPGQKSQ
jgi:cytochrome c peroxidase